MYDRFDTKSLCQDKIIHSLHPKLKKTSHTIKVDCPENSEVYCHAGAISQIFTNLIINSIAHGFSNINRGTINITVKQAADHVHIVYQDDGHGLDEEQLEQDVLEEHNEHPVGHFAAIVRLFS